MVATEESLKTVKDVLSKMYFIEDLLKIQENDYGKFERLWNKTFTDLNEKIIL
jgi:hypothetical protein